MKDLTILIPIDKFNETVKTHLNKCVESITDQTMTPHEVIIITSNVISDSNKEDFLIYEEIFKSKKIKFQLYTHNEITTIQHQINLGVKAVKTKYFSTIEFDDEYFYKWFENVHKNIKDRSEIISLYLPIVYNTNMNNEFIRFSNEVVWSATLSEDGLGFLDEELLLIFNDFQIMGAIFRTEDFIEVGGLKENIKLFFWNELIMRLSHNQKIIYVIPKCGYKHNLDIKDSFNERIDKIMTSDDIKFWFEKIKEEYKINEDRLIGNQ